MYTKEQIILNDFDKYLLSKPLPENPCYVKCNATTRATCGGCSDGSMYAETIKVYKDAGVFEYVIKIDEIRRLKREIADKEKMLADKYTEIPPEIREFV